MSDLPGHDGLLIPQKIEAEVSPDLRLPMFASAAGLDVALKQDDTGGWGFGGVG